MIRTVNHFSVHVQEARLTLPQECNLAHSVPRKVSVNRVQSILSRFVATKTHSSSRPMSRKHSKAIALVTDVDG